jgi:isoleucyl-tRNA synthetase
MAYKTLHYVLVRLSLVMAPFTPFLSEELYRNLTGQESVHLCDWPPAGHTNGVVLSEMSLIREVITQGLAQRAAAGVRVRQPLQLVNVYADSDIKPELLEIIAEELNVKTVNLQKAGKVGAAAELDLTITPELKQEGLARELIRHIQNARKQAGLNVDDRISLKLETESEQVRTAYEKYKSEIFKETLAVKEDAEAGHKETVKLDDAEVLVILSKTNTEGGN